MAEENRAITLFAGGADGFGDAINVGRDSYAWTYDFNCLALGQAVPSIVPTTVAYNVTSPIGCAFEWTDSSGNPLLLYGSGIATGSSVVVKIQDGVSSTDETDAANTRITDGVLYRHDGASADTAAAFFARGGTAGDSPIRRRKLDGTYADDDAKADNLGVVGGDLWRSQGYLMEKLTLGTSPITDANWGPQQTPVGLPTYPVNKILDYGGSPLALCGDGIFKYNASASPPRFENMTPFIEPHVDNGKGATSDGRGRIYYPTASGDILVLSSYGSLSQQRPTRFSWIDRDTPWGRISAMAADSEYVYAAVEPGMVRTQQLGLVVKKDLNGTFTTYTSQTTDQKYTTEANFTDVDTAGSDWIKIGADEQFWGVIMLLSSVRTDASILALDADYSITGGWTSVSVHDSTSVLFQDGAIVLSPSTDIIGSGAWQKRTEDGVSKYWLRIGPLTNSLAGVKVWQIYLIPYRPPLDADLFPEDCGRMLAGALPKILVGSWRGDNLVWHDVWTLDSPKIEQLLISRTTGANTIGGRNLWAISKMGATYISVGVEAHPARATWPYTNGGTHIIGFSGNHFGLPLNVKSTNQLVLHGEYLQSDDLLWFYYRWDNDDRWYKAGPHSRFPVVVRNLEGHGVVLYSAVALSDTTRDAIAPRITYVGIPEGEWTDEGPLEGLGTDIASPQAT